MGVVNIHKCCWQTGAYLVLDRTVRVGCLLDQLAFELLARGLIGVRLGLVVCRTRDKRRSGPVWRRWRMETESEGGGSQATSPLGSEGNGGEVHTCAALFFPRPRVLFIAPGAWRQDLSSPARNVHVLRRFSL